MLVAWVTSFIVGAVVARSGLSDWVALALGLGVIAASVAGVRPWRWSGQGSRAGRTHRVVVTALAAAAGFAWGYRHHAPAACSSRMDGSPVAVVARNGPYPGSGPLVVASSNGVRSEAYGPQASGILGRVRALQAAGLFARCRPFFTPTVRATPAASSRLVAAGEALRNRLVAGASAFPRPAAAWLLSVVVGDKSRLGRGIGEAFRKLGLYHLLVVSGQHVTLIALVLGMIVRAPLQLLYALRLISPRAWRQTNAATAIIAALLGGLYAYATGMSAASQRAAVVFAIWQVTHVFTGAMPTARRLLLAAAVQLAAFPVGALGEAGLMSWCAYLIVLGTRIPASAPWRRRVVLAGLMQLQLTFIAAGVFGQLAVLGLLANGLFVGIFSALVVLGLALVLWPTLPGHGLGLAIQATFVDWLARLGHLPDRWPWLWLPESVLPVPLRLAALLATAVIVLNTCRALTISFYEAP
jgi:predicted membrane metal-binding protein